MTDLRSRLEINPGKLESINNILLNPKTVVINDFLADFLVLQVWLQKIQPHL